MSVCRPCVVRQESICRPCKVRRASVIWPFQVRVPSGKGKVLTKVQQVWTRFTMPFGGYSPAALHRLPTSWGAKVCPFSGVPINLHVSIRSTRLPLKGLSSQLA